jgi:DNA-binding NtrC family response regulator
MAKVLVSDDEEVYRLCISAWLTRDCHEVRTASGGHEALEVGAVFKPDVLIVDWMLRDGYHGLEVAERLRKLKPSLLTILITGFPSDALKRDSLDARVFRFIEKPFQMQHLAAAVQDAVKTMQDWR